MKIIAVIPARYGSKRFPGKLLEKLGDKTIIEQTYLAALSTSLFDNVYVATDNKNIFSLIKNLGGNSIMSIGNFDCGSDRIASAIIDMDVDIVVNIQGDEPFMNKNSLSALINILKEDLNKEISLASLMTKIIDTNLISDPNTVKVIVDNQDFAIYFSRFGLPFRSDISNTSISYKHIGVYAFRKNALINFYNSKMTPLEKSEKIECLRYIENGQKIKMINTAYEGVSIDTPEDLEYAKSIWTNDK
tara:strand:+ start:1540 stop:2277 length:738 start_codon:yes stop_codon:yes gene_type:complete